MNIDALKTGETSDRRAWSEDDTLEFESWAARELGGWAEETAPSYGTSAQGDGTTQELASWAEETAPSYARGGSELESWSEESAPSYAREDARRRNARSRTTGRRRGVTANAGM